MYSGIVCAIDITDFHVKSLYSGIVCAIYRHNWMWNDSPPQWDAFSFPELCNFLRILQREEEEHVRQIVKRYALARDKMKQAMARITTPGWPPVMHTILNIMKSHVFYFSLKLHIDRLSRPPTPPPPSQCTHGQKHKWINGNINGMAPMDGIIFNNGYLRSSCTLKALPATFAVVMNGIKKKKNFTNLNSV